MAAQRKTKITKAEQAKLDRANAFTAIGHNPDNGFLAANQDIEVQGHDNQLAVKHARRLDAFDCLRAEAKRAEAASRRDGKKRPPGLGADDMNAIRRLEADLLIKMAQDDKGAGYVVVDISRMPKDRLDRVIDAARRIEAVFALLSKREAWLLSELICPSKPREHWRETVAYVTGDTNEMAQGAAVRWACASLTSAYERIDGGERPITLAMVRQRAATI